MQAKTYVDSSFELLFRFKKNISKETVTTSTFDGSIVRILFKITSNILRQHMMSTRRRFNILPSWVLSDLPAINPSTAENAENEYRATDPSTDRQNHEKRPFFSKCKNIKLYKFHTPYCFFLQFCARECENFYQEDENVNNNTNSKFLCQ